MSAITFQATPQIQDDGDGPRKRRKRAPAAGAAADCFTCANRGVKCDRKRPYCTNCLEDGQDCGGYKTQLTWGVGVASRGKLRGLSLPVAGTKKADTSTSPKRKRHVGHRNVSPTSPEATRGSQTNTNNQSNQLPTYQNEFQAQRTTIVSNAQQPRLSTSSPINIGWSNNLQMYPPHLSPLAYSAPTTNNQYVDHPRSTYQANPFPISSIMNPVYSQNEYVPYPTSHETYHQNTYPTTDPSMSAKILDDDVEEISRDELVSDTLSVSSTPLIFDMALQAPPSGVGSIGKTPRMQYLIQYYAEVIAPVIVAFDSPSNPFREQVLSLAVKNESLQHAISALAASNLRQRRETGALSTGKTLPARRSSAAHLTLTNEAWYESSYLPPREQKREEVYHKYHAVQSLNAALANQNLRRDDSVLATLLILCLFHICDSGIARFQTQFAGVKKLLTMRRNELGSSDDSTKWMTRLFTWFDAMAATVNEREGQFDNECLDSSALSDEEWSYETLAGVDGRLFKTMSKLGRLNILSQGRLVDETHTLVSRPFPYIDLNTLDGNGWSRLQDDERFLTSECNNPQEREQFWREWREVRQELQTWNGVTLQCETEKGPRLTDDQRIDVDNISNAFRYSALLYTERLGHPRVASSDEKIQFWVRRALHHIKQVRSDVYLLWPLFITGSECVHEEGRNIIRERCLDIQKDSGFINNASCLALLEKVWASVPVVDTYFSAANDESLVDKDLLDSRVNGFRFRDVMLAEGNDGEWIVV